MIKKREKNSFTPLVEGREQVEEAQKGASFDNPEKLKKLVSETEKHLQEIEQYVAKKKRTLEEYKLLLKAEDSENSPLLKAEDSENSPLLKAEDSENSPLLKAEDSENSPLLKDFFEPSNFEGHKKSFQEFKSTFATSCQDVFKEFNRLDWKWIDVFEEFYDHVMNCFDSPSKVADGMKEGESKRDSYVRLQSTFEKYRLSLSSYTAELIRQGEALRERTDYQVLNILKEGKYSGEKFDSYRQELGSKLDQAQQKLEEFCNKYTNANNPENFDIKKLVLGLLTTDTTKQDIRAENAELLKTVGDAFTQVALEKSREGYGGLVANVLSDLERLYKE